MHFERRNPIPKFELRIHLTVSFDLFDVQSSWSSPHLEGLHWESQKLRRAAKGWGASTSSPHLIVVNAIPNSVMSGVNLEHCECETPCDFLFLSLTALRKDVKIWFHTSWYTPQWSANHNTLYKHSFFKHKYIYIQIKYCMSFGRWFSKKQWLIACSTCLQPLCWGSLLREQVTHNLELCLALSGGRRTMQDGGSL